MGAIETTEAVRHRIGERSGIGATAKFVCGRAVIFVDATVEPNEVNNLDRNADCTIILSLEDLDALLDGSLDAMQAYTSGRLLVEGDTGVALALSHIL